MKDGRHSVGFLTARHEEADLARRRERGEREGESGNVRGLFGAPDRDHAAPTFPKGLLAREQGRGVTVRTHAEQHEVESRAGSVLPRSDWAEEAGVARRRRRRGSELAGKAMDSTTRYRNVCEERVPGHRVVALGRPRSDAPLVAEEHLGGPPREAVEVSTCEEPVQALGSVSSRQDPAEDAACADGLPGAFGDVPRRRGGLRGEARIDPDRAV
jgi:hypothetical protein